MRWILLPFPILALLAAALWPGSEAPKPSLETLSREQAPSSGATSSPESLSFALEKMVNHLAAPEALAAGAPPETAAFLELAAIPSDTEPGSAEAEKRARLLRQLLAHRAEAFSGIDSVLRTSNGDSLSPAQRRGLLHLASLVSEDPDATSRLAERELARIRPESSEEEAEHAIEVFSTLAQASADSGRVRAIYRELSGSLTRAEDRELLSSRVSLYHPE